MSSLSETTGNHWLGSASCASNFCWIWLIWEHLYHRLLFTLELICLNPRFTTYHDVIDVFQRTAIVICKHFFRLIDTSFFFKWDPIGTNFFDGQIFMQYWIYAGPTNAWSYFNFSIDHMMILQYQLAHSVNSFRNNNWFWTTFTKFVLTIFTKFFVGFDSSWNTHTFDCYLL